MDNPVATHLLLLLLPELLFASSTLLLGLMGIFINFLPIYYKQEETDYI